MREDLQAFSESLRRALRERYDPAALLRRVGAARQYDTDLHRLLMDDLGAAMLLTPESLGGADFGAEGAAQAFEAFGWALYDGPYLNHALHMQSLKLLEQEEDADALAVEKGKVALAWCDPEGGWSDFTALHGRLSGSGGVVASGLRTRVFDADLAAAFLAPVRIESRVLLVLFPKENVTIDSPLSLDLTRSCGRVRFSDAPGRVLGALPADAHGRLLAFLCLAAAAELTGLAQRCLELSVDYARTRFQFGRPIGSFQAVKHLCAEMACRVADLRASVVAATSSERAATARMAAAVCVEGAFANARDCIQVHGGIGFTWEHPAHLFYRRAAAWRALLPSVADNLAAYLTDQVTA